MNRDEQLQHLTSQDKFDIIIIGGGATGLGCAVDAASRGYRTLLLEKYDFAKGTSSRSTKLVHGGVRYLAQGNIRLVREALIERGRLLQNAPHICHTLAFVVPVYKWWQKWYYGIGLRLYELLSGKLSLGKTTLLSKKGALQYLPCLNATQLNGGIKYFDGQFNDSRLAISLARTAVEQGAVVLNYCGVNGFIKENNRITGVMATDELTGRTYEIKASVVINATGVFADTLLQTAEGHSEKTISPSQGIHLVVDQHFFDCNAAMMIPKTDDGRVLFVIPWQGKLLLGTTDTPVDQVNAEPKALQEEIDFIIGHFNRYSTAPIGYRDIKTVFAGLRPLAKTGKEKKTAVMPRDHHAAILPSGLVHLTGGKWTTYRSMAAYAVNKAMKTGGLAIKPCTTQNLKIHGYAAATTSHLSEYGSDAIYIQKTMTTSPGLAERIHAAYPYTLAEIKWMIEQEMAITVEDVLARRIPLLFLDAKAAIEAAPVVGQCFEQWTNLSKEKIEIQVNNFIQLATGYLLNHD